MKPSTASYLLETNQDLLQIIVLLYITKMHILLLLNYRCYGMVATATALSRRNVAILVKFK
jgi:hypothetical protein